jgi:hypothetical protein
MKLFALSCLAFLCACATTAPSSSSPDGPIIDRVRVSGTGDPNDFSVANAGPSSHNAILEHSADKVWPLVASAYSVLAIPVSGIDSVRQRVVGTIQARRVFRDQPVSVFLDCGRSLTGPNANTYSVAMRLTTQVEPTGPGTSRLRTLVDANGTGTGGATVRCSTTGELELQILNLVREGLSR